MINYGFNISLIDDFSNKLDFITKDLEKFKKNIESVNRMKLSPGVGGIGGGYGNQNISNAFSDFNRRIPSIGSTSALITSGVIGYGVTSLGKKIFDLGKDVDLYRKSIGFLVRDENKSEELIKNIENLALTTSLTMSTAFQNAKLLLGAGINPEDVFSKLKLANEIAVASGVSNENKNRFFFNFLQGYTKRNLDLRDVKQYGEYGIDVFKGLKDLLKDTNAFKKAGDINKLISEGRIGADIIEEFFKRRVLPGGRLEGVEKQMIDKTVQGKLTILESNWENQMFKIFKSTEPSIMKFIDSLTNFVKQIDKLVPAIMSLSEPFENFIDNILKMAQYIGLIPNAGGDMVDKIKQLIEIMKEFIDFYLKYVLPLQLASGGFKAIGSILGGGKSFLNLVGGVAGGLGLGAATAGVSTAAKVGSTALGLTPVALGAIVTSVIAILGTLGYKGYQDYNNKKPIKDNEPFMGPDGQWYNNVKVYPKQKSTGVFGIAGTDSFSGTAKTQMMKIPQFKFLDKFLPPPYTPLLKEEITKDEQTKKEEKIDLDKLLVPARNKEKESFGISGIGGKIREVKIEIQNALQLTVNNPIFSSQSEMKGFSETISREVSNQILAVVSNINHE